MQYIIVRTYGNGKHMNRVYPLCFEWLSQAEKMCEELNDYDKEKNTNENKWVIMPIVKFEGKVW